MRCVSRLFVSLVAVPLLGACDIGPSEPTVDPAILADLSPVCAGQAMPNAGSLATDGSSTNHVVLLDLAGQPFDWTSWIPSEWRPQSTADAELVTCATSEPARAVLQVCPYNGPDITRYAVTSEFAVYEPSSGDEVADFSITARPRACRPSEEMSLTELVGTIDLEMVTSHLASLVERGVFVDPDAPVSSHEPGKSNEPGQSTVPGQSNEPGKSNEPTPQVEEVELRTAIEQDLISVTGTGNGLSSLDLELASIVDRDLEVTIEVGTLLDPQARATQTMVVVSTGSVFVPAGDTAATSLDVACAQMNQEQPTGDDTFTVRPDSAESALRQLLGHLEFTAETFRVQQFAVWTVTSNPRRDDYVPLGTALTVFGTGPDREELKAITELFEAAGLDPGDYRALR